MAMITYREALNQALREEMHRDDRVVLMGEEVGHFQAPTRSAKGCWMSSARRACLTRPSLNWVSPALEWARRW